MNEEKHFIEKSDEYNHQWISTFGSKEESDKEILYLIDFLIDIRRKNHVLTKIIAIVDEYDPNKVTITQEKKEETESKESISYREYDIKFSYVYGFLEASAVNQTMGTQPMTENEFCTYRTQLIRILNNLTGKIYPMSLTMDSLNDLLMELYLPFKICHAYSITPGENSYVIYKDKKLEKQFGEELNHGKTTNCENRI